MTKISIIPIDGDRHRGPWCRGRVYVSDLAPYTSTQRRRVEMTAEKGIDRDQCGQPAKYNFDGELLCARHAGERALAILIDQPHCRARKRDWIIV